MLKITPFLSLKWCFSIQKERFKKIWEFWEGKSFRFFWISNVSVGAVYASLERFLWYGYIRWKIQIFNQGWVGQGGFCLNIANPWNIIPPNRNYYEKLVGCYVIEIINLYVTLSSLISAFQSNNDKLQVPLGTPLIKSKG